MNSRRHLKNNLLLIAQVWNACPNRIYFEIVGLFLNLATAIGSRILLIKLILDLLSKRASFLIIAAAISAAGLIELCALCFSSWMAQYYKPKSGLKIRMYFRTILYQHSMEMDFACFDQTDFYNRYTLAVQESDTRAVACFEDFCGFISTLLQMLICGGLIVMQEPALLLLAILPAICYGIFGEKIAAIKAERVKEVNPLERKQNYFRQVFYEAKYAKEIRATKVWKLLFRHFEENVLDIIEALKRIGRKMIPFRGGQIIVFYVQYIGIIGYLAMRALVFRNITLGDFSLLMNSAGSLSENWRYMGYTWGVVVEHGIFSQNYFDFFHQKPTLKQMEPKRCIRQEDQNWDIRLKQVTFQYEEQDNALLNQVDLCIPAGSKVAFVGSNGAGKSTLVKLILRLYDPVSGSVFLGENKITSFEPGEYRALFGVVFQDFQTFAVSIAENIILRDAKTTEDIELVEKSLELAGLKEKVKSLPNGIYTNVSKEFDENGIVFSGGELQKLAIARAVAQNPKILILDEPSSALDPMMEHEINLALLRIMKDRTVILISHRLSTVCDVDKICFLHHGHIEEEGTHEELLAKNGRYAHMFRLQASQY